MNEHTSARGYKCHQFPPAIIRHAAWRDFRSAPSYRDVEQLPAERGVLVSNDLLRSWSRTFILTYANALRRHRPRPGDQWHLDEVFIRINGVEHSLQRAV